jgi:hypothetical protein
MIFILLLESLEDDSNLYRRLGLVRQAYQRGKSESDATILQMLARAEIRELEIVATDSGEDITYAIKND